VAIILSSLVACYYQTSIARPAANSYHVCSEAVYMPASKPCCCVWCQVSVAILSLQRKQSFSCPHPVSYGYDVANTLIIVSSSTNFIIYFFLRPHFRAALRDRLTCADPRRPDDLSLQSVGALWRVDSVRAGAVPAANDNVKLKVVVDDGYNHIDQSPIANPPATTATPLISLLRQNRSSATT